MIRFLENLLLFIVSSQKKLREPVTAPRRKVILVGIGIIVLVCAVLLIL